jgi:acylphosphatase
MSENVRAHAIIRGRVQGVFFRVETQRAAEKQNVTGWVRNKPDGTVEAVFEGPKDRVDATLQWCRQGPQRAAVDDVDVNWEPFSGQYSRFEVAY